MTRTEAKRKKEPNDSAKNSHAMQVGDELERTLDLSASIRASVWAQNGDVHVRLSPGDAHRLEERLRD